MFDRQRLTDSVLASLRDQELALPYHQEVRYEGTGMLKPMLRLEDLAQEITDEQVVRYIDDIYEALFFHEVLDWESEHEYRFCTIGRGADPIFVDTGDALHAVIVGERFPVWQRPAAIEACRLVEAQALRLDWSRGEPALRKLRSRQGRRDVIREAIEAGPGPGPPQAPRQAPAEN